jgi:hypothetical protein
LGQPLEANLCMLRTDGLFAIQKKKITAKRLTFAYDPFESSDDVLFAHGKHIWT